ncbi:uncharacterized protein KZ484_013790 [Pholidichthys leucotaenia]
MEDTTQSYQNTSYPRQDGVWWKRFFVIEAGRTEGAHHAIIAKFRGFGQIQVKNSADCDYLLVFCPVVSRIGTDIEDALNNIPPGKPVVLVVMHHAFSPHHVVIPSRGQVENSIVRLTVDCQFFDGKLLQCDLNNTMWDDIARHFGVTITPTIWEKLRNVWWKRFFVIEAGRTEGAHHAIIAKFRGFGQIQVKNSADCDYLLVFCPVVSRIGTDIEDALNNIPPGKPVVLVVMHHAFSPHHVVIPSRGQVENSIVRLTVDCQFFDGKLLQCDLNNTMWDDIARHFGVTITPTIWENLRNGILPTWDWIAVGVAVLLLIMLIVILIVLYHKPAP